MLINTFLIDSGDKTLRADLLQSNDGRLVVEYYFNTDMIDKEILNDRSNMLYIENYIQNKLKKRTNKNIEVMVFGDGGFKDPVGKIWELADPVISPGFTAGLKGVTSEIKIKYLVDNELNHLSREEAAAAVKEKINGKAENMAGREEALGTTPRQLTDLLGSLCDLTSGSGDKGTPVILVQGYFDNYATD